MAAVVPQYSTTGFCKISLQIYHSYFFLSMVILIYKLYLPFLDRAPVSKGLMGMLLITCTAINIPFLSHLRRFLVCHLPDAILEGEVIFLIYHIQYKKD